MSRWMLPLIGVLGTALMAPPLAAQENPWRTAAESAPMPRAKPRVTLTLSVGRSTLPSELAKITAPSYIIEAPDVLTLEVALRTKNGIQQLPEQTINGRFLVRPDGTVGLGLWGSVTVSGLTLEQAADAVRQHLRKMKPFTDLGSKAENLVVIADVLAFNSKRYYIIADNGDEGQQVHAFPLTGNETVLDAVSNAGGAAPANKSKIWVARPNLLSDQILPVDWVAITQRGITTTNYQIMAGDRIYVKNEKNRTTTPTSAAPSRLTGTWYREAAGTVAAITFHGDELKIVVTAIENDETTTMTLIADCAATKDGTVHGVFTGADVDLSLCKDENHAQELAEFAVKLQEAVDQPFAIRCRSCEGGLMVSNVRFPGGEESVLKGMHPDLCGRFKLAANGTVPKPKATKRSDRNEACFPPMEFAIPLPPPSYSPQTYPVTPANGPPESNSAPRFVSPRPMVCPAPGVNFPPPEVHAMMFQTFGQMLGSPVPCPATAIPTTYFAPPPLPAPSKSPMPNGIWIREVGAMRYKLEMKENHLTATITFTDSEAGKTMSIDHVLTADWYPTRNAGEVVGLITGFDITARGTGLDKLDSRELMKVLPAIQKAFGEKPIAFTFRLYDDAMVIGNVRFPTFAGEMNEMAKAFEGIAGRYKLSSGAVVLPAAASEPARIDVEYFLDPPVSPSIPGGAFSPPMPPPVPFQSETFKRSNPFRDGGASSIREWAPAFRR